MAGSLTWTPARRPVPKLDGQVRTYPRCSFHMKEWPRSFIKVSILVRPSQKRLKTAVMSPPFCIAMTRRWSSSLTQTKKVLLSLCQMPRASGQSRAMPAQERRGWLVEEEMIGDQLILLGFSHLGKREVPALVLTLETGEGIDGDLLDGTTLTTRAVGGKADSLDGTAGTDAGRKDVLVVEKSSLEVLGVQVGLVLGVLAV